MQFQCTANSATESGRWGVRQVGRPSGGASGVPMLQVLGKRLGPVAQLTADARAQIASSNASQDRMQSQVEKMQLTIPQVMH